MSVGTPEYEAIRNGASTDDMHRKSKHWNHETEQAVQWIEVIIRVFCSRPTAENRLLVINGDSICALAGLVRLCTILGFTIIVIMTRTDIPGAGLETRTREQGADAQRVMLRVLAADPRVKERDDPRYAQEGSQKVLPAGCTIPFYRHGFTTVD